MANCGQSTFIMGKPTPDQAANISCAPCGSGGNSRSSPAGCPGNISSRPNREKTREDIKDYCLLMLGAPVVKIELDMQQLDLAVDMAMKVFEDYCPRDYFEYYVFHATPGQSVYTMPPDVGLIRNVFYNQEPRFTFQAEDLDGAIPLEYFNPGGAGGSFGAGLVNPQQPIWGNMGEWVLYKQYAQMYANVSSSTGGWEWISGHNSIKIYPSPTTAVKVIVHYLQKCKDWKELTQVLAEGAHAYCLIMLGRIRSKFSGSFGPANSAVQLDGASMLQEGLEAKKDWEEKLITKFGDILPIFLA